MAGKVNFAAVADFEAIPAGEYECVFRYEKIAPAPKSGNNTLYAQYIVGDTNQKIFKAYSLEAKALWALKRDLIRLGASLEDMNSENADIQDIVDSINGVSCVVICDEPYWYPLDKDTGAPTPDAKLRTSFKEVKDPTKL